MKISQNINQAENNYPRMYHVVNSNEVHSFETLKEAATDLIEGINQEEKLKTKFKCELIAPKLAVIYCGSSHIFDPCKKVFAHYRGNVDETSYYMLYNDAVIHLEKINEEVKILGKLEAYISEINNYLTFNIVFDDDNSSNDLGFYNDFNYCFDYINKYNGTNYSYFEDYKGGSVSIYCNETAEIVYSTEVY